MGYQQGQDGLGCSAFSVEYLQEQYGLGCSAFSVEYLQEQDGEVVQHIQWNIYNNKMS